MPIVTLGADFQPGETVASRWKDDLVSGWNLKWRSTMNTYGDGKGTVEGLHDSLDKVIATLADRYHFNHPKGEVPNDMALKWLDGWEQSRQLSAQKIEGSIPGFMYYGSWASVFNFARRDYLDSLLRKDTETEIISMDTLSMLAERAVAKTFLDYYGKLLSGYGSLMTTSEKDFMKYYFLDWKLAKSDADKAKASSIMSRVGFEYSNPDLIQKELYKVFIAAGGKEEDWMKFSSNSSTEKIISNGSSRPVTAVDWNDVQGNQKVVTELKDGSYISPLNTMFIKPAALATDQALVQELTAPPKVSPVAVAGIGFLLWTLFRR